MSINANFTFFFVLLSSLAISSFTDNLPTTYEVLSGYNFPIGILPKGATGYDLDKATGRFRAYLNGSCSFSLEGSYQLKYKSTVSGYISENKLTDLSGSHQDPWWQILLQKAAPYTSSASTKP